MCVMCLPCMLPPMSSASLGSGQARKACKGQFQPLERTKHIKPRCMSGICYLSLPGGQSATFLPAASEEVEGLSELGCFISGREEDIPACLCPGGGQAGRKPAYTVWLQSLCLFMWVTEVHSWVGGERFCFFLH